MESIEIQYDHQYNIVATNLTRVKEDYRVSVRKFKRKAGIQILPFQGIESQDLI
jgi:hypothetical protein